MQVLLLVDASYGFEMEHFEFLNICQAHGMPKIMGVLNHLDQIPVSIYRIELKHNKCCRETSLHKTLKQCTNVVYCSV